MIPTSAITTRATGLAGAIISEPTRVCLSENLARVFHVIPTFRDVRSLWDTGASKTCISTRLADALGLPMVSMTTVCGVGGRHDVRVFNVEIIISERIRFPNCEVIEFHDSTPLFDVLIGMDIIALGDLSITNANKTTVFSFRIPSGNEHVDFVEEINRKNAATSRIKKYQKKLKHKH